MKTTGSTERSTERSTDRQTGKPGTTGPIAAFVRFVVCGGGVGLLSSDVMLILSGWLPLALANALVTVGSTLLATELHGRFTFRAGRAQLSDHLKSGLTAAICYLFTTAALLTLHAVHPNPGPLLEQSVYLSASGLAGIGRFVALRVIVFAKGGTKPAPSAAPAPALAPALGQGSVAVAA
ncbi:hypothetical protein QMK19_28550 [Streptomyces sp. H10-C2]|uniref:GtrA family protein n=1 Tax=unclassified Streptomyces TaxID=2593676 RepID=UPI0024B9E427|nr:MULTISPECIES: GtrA family protein [unclassified Streptomyces]MDJ0344011.1 hypothetical protein [Streptomyces sp. PH10-H1]MDJ0373498.1 hypothetical protein [Streptomyces sp. H10-C2]